MSTTIEDRVILILRYETGEYNPAVAARFPNSILERFKTYIGMEENERESARRSASPWSMLEQFTGVSIQRWRKVYSRRQRPTPDMLAALAELFPKYAFWLTTGITDAINGHIAPPTAQTFPERLSSECHSSSDYFNAQLKLLKRLYEDGGICSENADERLKASERAMPFAHWWDSPLCQKAYELAQADEYAALVKKSADREIERAERSEYSRFPEKRPWVKKQSEWKASSIDMEPVVGIDPRTRHQDMADLFYLPPPVDDKLATAKVNS